MAFLREHTLEPTLHLLSFWDHYDGIFHTVKSHGSELVVGNFFLKILFRVFCVHDDFHEEEYICNGDVQFACALIDPTMSV